MIVAESNRGRRLVAQLERGTELVEAVTALCRSRGVKSGVLSAWGTVEEAEVREFDSQARTFHPPRRFTGSLTVVHLGGHVSERGGALHLEAACALAREGDNGVQLIGGRLVRANVYAVQIVVECFDDLLLRSRVDSTTGLTLWHEVLAEQPVNAPAIAPAASSVAPPMSRPPSAPAPTPAPLPQVPAPRFEAAASGHVVARPAAATAPSRAMEPAPTPSSAAGDAGLTWAEVAARSAAQGPVEAALADGDDDGIRAGDVIEHPRFGRCEVERIEGGGEYAQVRLRNRRLVRLSLDVIHLVRDGRSEEGQRRFRAQVAT